MNLFATLLHFFLFWYLNEGNESKIPPNLRELIGTLSILALALQPLPASGQIVYTSALAKWYTGTVPATTLGSPLAACALAEGNINNDPRYPYTLSDAATTFVSPRPAPLGDIWACRFTFTLKSNPTKPFPITNDWVAPRFICPANWGLVSVSYGLSPSVICARSTAAAPPNPAKNLPPPSCTNSSGNDGPGTGGAVGNPINPGAGDKFQTESDYAGGTGLGLQRSYHSSDYTLQSTIGAHWRHSYERRVNYNPGAALSSKGYAVVIRPSGQQLVFIRAANTTTWSADADINDKLESITASGAITGLTYTLADGTIETYDALGKLLSLKTRSGYTQNFTYSTAGTPRADLLLSVTDSYNRSLGFTYDRQARIATVTDPAGGMIHYGYDARGNLTNVTYPDQTTRGYLYNEPAHTAGTNQPYALTGIIDASGQRYATFAYDANGKAVSTEHAGGVDRYALSYQTDSNGNPTSATVTDPLGTTYTRQFTSVLGTVKSLGQNQPAGPGGSCPAAGSSLSYDAQGNLTRRVDFNGNVSCHAYNSRNLETVRVEGLAPGSACPGNLAGYSPAANSAERKISTNWHAVWRLPLQKAEPKRLTTYT